MLKKEMTLMERLMEYGSSDAYPFHMPGHKRCSGDMVRAVEQIDITEITGFDNLHHAEGILKEGQERLARVFGADESYYLINGSTCGLLAAISGCLKKGERILVARNCHKAVYHGIYLMELEAEYLSPEVTAYGIQGSIDPQQVQEKLAQDPMIKAVLITSPTYDGVVSDIRSIADIVHAYGIPFIVDEAHGAHFGFAEGFPEKALALGADLCVESVHKTLPAFTQTAVLHLKKNKKQENGMAYYFQPDRVKRYLSIYQTSSPSYVLMAGIDRSVRTMEAEGKELLEKLCRNLKEFYEACQDLQRFRICPAGSAEGIWDRDASKILISTAEAGISGQELLDCLQERYHLELEMAAGDYATALTSVMDTEEGFQRLAAALYELDGPAIPGKEDTVGFLSRLYRPGDVCLRIAEAMDQEYEIIPLQESGGKVSCEFVYLYPPGIPIIAPGEKIRSETLELLADCKARGHEIEGMQDLSGERIRVSASIESLS